MTDTFSGLPSFVYGPEPAAQSLLGNYRLLHRLGAGGMGQVWKAAHQTTGETYALKLLPSVVASHPDAWDQVLSNFQLVRKLHHQHICPVHLLERDPQWGPYLVMTFVEGITLTRYAKQKGPLSPQEVAEVLRPVAEALDYAHAQRVIHRDVKHDNILLTLDEAGSVTGTMVIDFGLAAQIRSTVSRFSQQTMNTAGTRPYMAPEVWRSRPPVAGSDQYSLAVIAYELLSSSLPFDNDDVAVLRESVIHDPVEEIGSAAAANACLSRALAKSPADRFANCRDFLVALAASESTTTGPITSRSNEEVCHICEAEGSVRTFVGLGHFNRRLFPHGPDGRLEAWRKAASAGDFRASYVIGWCSVFGDGCQPDVAAGLAALEQAINGKHGDAAFLRGLLWSTDGRRFGLPVDEKKSFQLMELGASLGSSDAMGDLGGCFILGSGTTKDIEMGIRWAKTSADAGSIYGKCILGGALLFWREERDLSRGVSLLKEATDAGSIMGMALLSLAYATGTGVEPDQTRRISLLQGAAEHEFPGAMRLLGDLYSEDKSGMKDSVVAVKWYRQAADLGDPDAMIGLGNAFAHGNGVVKDLQKARYWMQKAAQLGESRATDWLTNDKRWGWIRPFFK